MSDSNESDSVEQSSDFYESSDSSQETVNSSDNEETGTSSNDTSESSSDDEESESSSDDEESESSSNNGSENSSDDDHEDISEWNYHVPKRNLKQFNATSNISRQNYSKFRPIDFFKLLFTDQLLEMLWKQTNIYGEQRHGTNWIPIEITEITKWIGLNILMGYHKLPSYKSYWSSNLNFKVPILCETMSRNLFTRILTNIHLTDNKKMSSRTSNKYSKTYKVDEFLEILQNNFKKNYTLGEHVSVDESMIKFKGRCSLKQYPPKKPIKRGFKVWTLADSTNGYVYDFRIYKGKDPNRTTSLGEHIVKDMVKEIKYSYRKVYFDNYFTTPNLLQYLYGKGIYAAGTIRTDRKNMPKDFCCSKKKMNRSDFEYVTSRHLVLHKWMDKKLVFLLPNFHNPTSYGITQRKAKTGGTTAVKCPTSIMDYNRFMGGVDRADQRKESYALDRKSRRWWLRIFFNFMNISLSNAFVLLKTHTHSNMTYLNFLSSITTSLIEEGKSKKRAIPSKYSNKKKNRSSGRKISMDTRNNTGLHLPVVGNRSRCAFCSTSRHEHRSIYHCSHCKRAFCMNPKRNCFYNYHKNIL